MNMTDERRTEERLRYHWPIWFAEDVNGELGQGQMMDISSQAAAFTCRADYQCPYPGQHLTARFSVPKYAEDGAFDVADFVRSGHISRVEEVNSVLRRITMHFGAALPFHPGEQEAALDETESAGALKLQLV
jgi:hypothetical protein